MEENIEREQRLARMIDDAYKDLGTVDGSRILGCTIYNYDSMKSTQEFARGLIGSKRSDGMIVLADEVKDAHGRFGREWHAPKGGLWFTLIRHDLNEFYGMAACVSVCEALQKYVPAKARWPNDVYVNEKKIAGILVEEVLESELLGASLVGVGINVNNNMEGILDTATSIVQETGREADLDYLFANVVARMKKYFWLAERYAVRRLELWDYGKEAENPIVARFKELTDIIGREVRYKPPAAEGEPQAARAVDILDDGRLVVKVNDDRVLLNSEEITLV